eukprot:scaffold14066_cov40-Cyclotella_meneghiniana.AAC.14
MKRLVLAFGNFMTGVHEFINEQIDSGNRKEMIINSGNRRETIRVDDVDMSFNIHSLKSKRIDWPDTRSGFVYPTNAQHQSDEESEDTEDEGGINILQHGDDIEDEAILDDVDIGGNDDNPPIAHVVSDAED